MRYLFFFVHPSKFHVFRQTINYLKRNGHQVDILITKKDVLEDLIINEGWDYKNIFPKGRKFQNVSPYVSAGVNFFITIFRLFKFCRKKKYDLFITDDLLVYIGKVLNIPSIVFLDDDLAVVKQFSIVLCMANHCLAPEITDIGKFKKKKIPFDGYKELAYLHPNHFNPKHSVVKAFNPTKERYFIIRVVLLKSYHDVGKSGLSDKNLWRLINLLSKHGRVYISTERELPDGMNEYKLKLRPNDIAHALYFADMYIGDSQTMASEAAILGIPTFRINDFKGKISVMNEKEEKYRLSKSYSSNDFDVMFSEIKKSLHQNIDKGKYKSRSLMMLKDKIDLSLFMMWFLSNYNRSLIIKHDTTLMENFISSVNWKEI